MRYLMMRYLMMFCALSGVMLCGTGCDTEPDAIISVACGESSYDPAVGHQVARTTAQMTIEVHGETHPGDYQRLLGLAGYGDRKLCVFTLEYAREGE